MKAKSAHILPQDGKCASTVAASTHGWLAWDAAHISSSPDGAIGQCSAKWCGTERIKQDLSV